MEEEEVGWRLLHGARQSGNIFPPGTQCSALDVTQFGECFSSLGFNSKVIFSDFEF